MRIKLEDIRPEDLIRKVKGRRSYRPEPDWEAIYEGIPDLDEWPECYTKMHSDSEARLDAKNAGKVWD